MKKTILLFCTLLIILSVILIIKSNNKVDNEEIAHFYVANKDSLKYYGLYTNDSLIRAYFVQHNDLKSLLENSNFLSIFDFNNHDYLISYNQKISKITIDRNITKDCLQYVKNKYGSDRKPVIPIYDGIETDSIFIYAIEKGRYCVSCP